MLLLDQIRAVLNRPIGINSGYRCDAYNDRLPGAKKGSAHTKGKAVDIKYKGSIQRYELLTDICIKGITRIGIAETFIHIDVDESKPQCVIWIY